MAFSSICHLIKRVGMQDPNALRASSQIALPILLNRLLDPKVAFQSQAKSALETFWLATPTIVENYIKDSGLIHSNAKIRSESIIFISNLIELNKNFNFGAFLPNLVNLTRDDAIEVVKNVEVLLLKYYTIHKSKLNDLVKELKNQKIEPKVAVKILREIDPAVANSYVIEPKAVMPKTTIDTFNNISRAKRTVPSAVVTTTSSIALSASKELSEILSKIPTAKLDESVSPIYVETASELAREVDSLLGPFEGKETEFNWNSREKNIIRFRGLIIANAEHLPEELVQATRTLGDGIFKSITSLRTTLSSNGCQVVKELAAHLHKQLDVLAESLFQPLASLSSATKKISSLNAFGSMSVLLTNTSFNGRLFNQSYQLFQDKNVQPRLYSSTFLQIFILKHGSKLDQMNLETIKKWVSKGVSDPNITVRESMRVTFWLLSRKFPEVGALIYSKQDISVKKALERSKPHDIQGFGGTGSSIPKLGSSIAVERKRQTVREFVAAKQRDRRSTSGPPLATYQGSTIAKTSEVNEISSNSLDLGRPGRIGVPQRVGTRVSSSGSIQPLPRQPSKGSLKAEINDRQQRWPSLGSVTRDNIVSDVPKIKNIEQSDSVTLEEVENLKNLLQSQYTRERAEGIKILKECIVQGMDLPDVRTSLNNLVILDAPLLKPLLNKPKFFELIDVVVSIKVLAVNKENLDCLLEKFDEARVIEGLVSLVKLLNSLKFDNAPSTMFHIKYKNLFLNFAVQNLYLLTSKDEVQHDDTILSSICSAIFPLSISDYPKYDELVVQLYSINPEIFQEVLSSSSAYVNSKVSSIIEEFKDDISERPANDFTEGGLGEMTMINPLSRKTTDPTLSLTSGFKTDMTRVIPDFKNSIYSEKKEAEEDKDTMMGSLEDEENIQKVDYMSDIFTKPRTRENSNEVEYVKEETPELETQQNSDIEVEDIDENSGEEEQPADDVEEVRNPIKLDYFSKPDLEPENRVGSPFIDNPEDDDMIDIRDSNIHTDDMTRNITSKISEIHISPEKKFTPDRKSLTKMIHASDPIFNQPKKIIKIYEDMPSASTQHSGTSSQRKLFDFELSRFQYFKDSTEVTVESLKQLAQKFDDDDVDATVIDSMIRSLHKVINAEELVIWMKNTGFKTILKSVIHYFNSSVNITKQLCFKGLIVLKELFIINNYLDGMMTLEDSLSIWNILIMVVENLKSFKNEIYISVDELVEELLTLDIVKNTNEVLKSCCAALESSDSVLLTSFLLLTLTRCIDRESLSLSQIKEIDEIVYRFLSNDEVEIRRLTIITYSKCKRKLQSYDTNSQTNGSMKFEIFTDKEKSKEKAQDIYKDVFGKLSIPERKLVDYYCDY